MDTTSFKKKKSKTKINWSWPKALSRVKTLHSEQPASQGHWGIQSCREIFKRRLWSFPRILIMQWVNKRLQCLAFTWEVSSLWCGKQWKSKAKNHGKETETTIKAQNLGAKIAKRGEFKPRPPFWIQKLAGTLWSHCLGAGAKAFKVDFFVPR